MSREERLFAAQLIAENLDTNFKSWDTLMNRMMGLRKQYACLNEWVPVQSPSKFDELLSVLAEKFYKAVIPAEQVLDSLEEASMKLQELKDEEDHSSLLVKSDLKNKKNKSEKKRDDEKLSTSVNLSVTGIATTPTSSKLKKKNKKRKSEKSSFAQNLEVLQREFSEEVDVDCSEERNFDKTSDKTVDKTSYKTVDKTSDKTVDKTSYKTVDKTSDKTVDKTSYKTVDKTSDKTVDKTLDKTLDKTSDKTVDKTSDVTSDKTLNKTSDKTSDVTSDKTSDVTSDKTFDMNLDKTLDQDGVTPASKKKKKNKKKYRSFKDSPITSKESKDSSEKQSSALGPLPEETNNAVDFERQEDDEEVILEEDFILDLDKAASNTPFNHSETVDTMVNLISDIINLTEEIPPVVEIDSKAVTKKVLTDENSRVLSVLKGELKNCLKCFEASLKADQTESGDLMDESYYYLSDD